MPAPLAVAEVGSLGDLFHPHAIEVQDFSHYALVVDVRSQAEFDDDHIPGAVRLSPDDVPISGSAPAPSTGALALTAVTQVALSPVVAALLAPLERDQAILVYCGRGGRDSLPLAKALRQQGWRVDVLPGGWINYRRWVAAGLETLSRSISFRVVSAALRGEVACVLEGLAKAGQQVVDVDALSGYRPSAFCSATAPQPTQAWFESRLLQVLRRLDGRRPVWVADTDRQLDAVTLPGAWADAVAAAPIVSLASPQPERLARWRSDEPVLTESSQSMLHALATSSSPEARRLLAACAGVADPDKLAVCLLAEQDAIWQMRRRAERRVRQELPALVTASLTPDLLTQAVQAWLPMVSSR